MNELWRSPILRTRVRTKDVSLVEMALGYFLGPFCVLMMTSVVASYYLTYYRTYDDIVAQGSFLTLLPLLSVIPMAIANILIGILVGKTRTAAGKARPYILAAAPILLLSGILVFCIPELSLGARMVWMAVTYNLFAAVANPIYGTSHYLMVSLSTRDLQQRGRLSVIANIPAVAGNGLVSSILMPLILSWINEAEGSAAVHGRWQTIMVLFSILAAAGCLIEYWFTRERITEEDMVADAAADAHTAAGTAQADTAVSQGPAVPVSEQLRAVTKDRLWWIIMIFYALYQMGVMFKGGYIFNIYCHEFLADTTILGITMSADMIQSVLALISGIPLAVGMLFIWPLANRFGKRNVVIAGCVISIVGSVVCLAGPSNFAIMLIGQTLKGFSSIPGAYVMMALFADVLDHLEATLGYRVDGISMSVYNTILTVVNGLAVAVFNYFYDSGWFAPSDVAAFFFLGFEIIAHGILILVMSRMDVEDHIEEEQAIIAARKGLQEAGL